MKKTYTKGPLEACGWLVRDKYDGSGGFLVADCSALSNGSHNARLFAAAPELLEACKQALIVMTNYPISCEEQHVLCDGKHETAGCSICKVMSTLSASIAKATGESCPPAQ